jgi:hypothetical protein
MDAQAIEDLGGILQIIGTAIVVVDLLAIYGYLGVPERLKTRLHPWRIRVEGRLRRLLGLRGRDAVVRVGTAAAAVGFAGAVKARVTAGPFVPQPDLPLPEQLAAHAEYLNRLRDWMAREVQQRDEAIREEREQARVELQAERERVDGLLAIERERFNRLHKLTTSGTGLRWLAALVLVVGTTFSTWPEGLARWWPTWLSVAMLLFLVACCAVAWICWLIQARLRADSPA